MCLLSHEWSCALDLSCPDDFTSRGVGLGRESWGRLSFVIQVDRLYQPYEAREGHWNLFCFRATDFHNLMHHGLRYTLIMMIHCWSSTFLPLPHSYGFVGTDGLYDHHIIEGHFWSGDYAWDCCRYYYCLIVDQLTVHWCMGKLHCSWWNCQIP